MGLITEAAKKIAAIKAAEFISMVLDELEKKDEHHPDDGSTTDLHLDNENPALLDGAIVAKNKIGFSSCQQD